MSAAAASSSSSSTPATPKKSSSSSSSSSTSSSSSSSSASTVRSSFQKPTTATKPQPVAKQDLWTQIVQENQEDVTQSKDESTVIMVGPWHTGKSTLIQAFINKDKDDIPPATTGLDYQIARISTAAPDALTDIQMLYHFWEIGGGKTMSKLTEICLHADVILQSMAVIVLDLSRPWRVMSDLQHWLNTIKAQIGACLKTNPRAAPALLDKARVRFKSGGDGKDMDKVDLFPIPLLIVATKFDMFKDNERELLRIMARSLRCVAHANGASLLYVSSKSKPSLQSFRIRFKSFLMQQAWPKLPSNESTDSREQMFQAGSDSFEKIGFPPAPHDTQRNLVVGWSEACSATFKSDAVDDEAELSQPLAFEKESMIDNILSQKRDELQRLIREQALQKKLDGVELEQ